MTEQPILLSYAPGVVSEQSPQGNAKRFMDCSWVRFWRGKAQKIGGYVGLFRNTFHDIVGTPRGAWAWSDTAKELLIAVGTSAKLYYLSNVDFLPVNITPWRVQSSGLVDPITTAAGSDQVLIHYVNHNALPGDTVDIDLATDVDNFAPNGAWIITTLSGPNDFFITAPQAALNAVTGGGAGVFIGIEISPGIVDPAQGYGWGAGTWGTGTWGTPRGSGFVSFEPRAWSFGNFGRILISVPNNGGIYAFDPNTLPVTRAAQIPTGPTASVGVVVTSDEIVIAYGSSYDPDTAADGGPTKQNQMQWWAAAQGDYTNWDTTAIAGAQGSPSIAGTLVQGTRIIAAVDLGVHVTLFWTDTALYTFQYTGSQYVFNVQLAGKECGLIGPLGMVAVGSRAFWMGPNGFFMFDGGVSRIPNYQDISEWVLRQLRPYFTVKTTAWYNQEFNEVWFGFVDVLHTEPFCYVAVNLDDYTWTRGMFKEPMSSATHFSGFDARPIVVGSDGDVYQFDNGLDADGEPLPWYLQWGPVELGNGATNQEISGLVLDMERQQGTIACTMTAYDRTPAGQTILDQQTRPFIRTDNLVDFRVAGRNVIMRWDGGTTLGDDFRIGIPKILTSSAGARR